MERSGSLRPQAHRTVILMTFPCENGLLELLMGVEAPYTAGDQEGKNLPFFMVWV